MNNNFWTFFRVTEDDYMIFVYDENRKPIAEVRGKNFFDTLCHALQEGSPLLANVILGEKYIEWVEEHKERK